MSHLRYDATEDDWIIVAADRGRRPHEMSAAAGGRETSDPSTCPFCPGHEDRTPRTIDAIDAIGGGTGGAWLVRVVPNKYPALRRDPAEADGGAEPLFRRRGGYGAHEVIVESPDHWRGLAYLPVEQVERVLRMVHRRHVALMRDERLKAVVAFENHGPSSGTSLRHPHVQILATPVAPPLLRRRVAVALAYRERYGRCLYEALREAELAEGVRVLEIVDPFVALLPFASRMPFQVRILPREPVASFGRAEAGRLGPLAALLQRVLRRLDVGLHDPDYNLIFNSAPCGEDDPCFFLWHVDIVPRLTTPAGFELGSGMPINPVAPEEAAGFLRGVVPPPQIAA
jgi:UDPglucose--hexose-1-phosphate uridylyltransferase